MIKCNQNLERGKIQMKEFLIGILLLGFVTGIIPVMLLILIEKYKILFIMLAIFDICWIGSEIKNWIYEG